MLGGYFVGDQQALSGSLGALGREKHSEKPLASLLVHADTVVGDLQNCILALAVAAHDNLVGPFLVLARGAGVDCANRGEIVLDVENAGKNSTYLSLEAFYDNAREHKTPLNNADSALRSVLVAMLGRTAIYEKRIVTWDEVAG